MKRFGLLTLAGVLYFLGQVGFDWWPLNLVAFVPALWALDTREREPISRLKLFWLCAWMGAVAMAGGYYWVVQTLEVFTFFPWIVCVLLASLLWLYQGGSLALILWLASRGIGRGYSAALVLPAAVCAGEILYPQLFGWYMGNALHNHPFAIQVADLGGPMLLSALLGLSNGVLYEVWRARRASAPLPRMALAVGAGAWALTLAYGAYRVHETDARAAEAKKLKLGIVQANMGLALKRVDIEEGLDRHIEQSLVLEKRHDLDLLVWSESAFAYFIPEKMKNVKRMILGPVETPTLFGALRRIPRGPLEADYYNTAFLANAEGDVLGTYDKTYLLMFGEYIPFGNLFPQLYDFSPNSGEFTPGNHVRPLTLNGIRMSALICYEDIIPSFVRRAVNQANPHLLVNITNDAWFGNTLAPWQHLALAKFRSVEHHRTLVRATNTGVSGVIDPVGRLVKHGPLFQRDQFVATVPLLTGQSIYALTGDWPGWVGLLGILWLAFAPRRKRAVQD